MNDPDELAPPDTRVDALRVRAANARPVRRDGPVVYWMIAARRAGWSFGLERAIEWARALGKPLIVLEALRVAYPWASDRLHRFVLDGMADNATALERAPVLHHPYVEPEPGRGRGLLVALAERAALVVTDEFPSFFLPRMVSAAARVLPVRLEVVDSNGLVPLRATPGPFATAFAFRRWLQANLRPHLERFPLADPLRGLDLPLAKLPAEIERRWPRADPELLAGAPEALAALPIDHTVGVVPTRGGSVAGEHALRTFVAARLAAYGEGRNHPDAHAASALSPYLHFGHLSAHRAFAAVVEHEGWAPERLSARRDGRKGWFGVGESAEEFLEQLVTWRELGFVFAFHRPDHDRYASLPDWARATLEAHATGNGIALERLERAETDDALWNAAQTELVREGRLHNYLRMLWGKKILEWSPSPSEALARLIHLNNKYALDGRDPNSYSGIFWCLGRFDRPWGPKRPVFGTVRAMSSAAAKRKLHLAQYLARYGASGESGEPRERRGRRSRQRRGEG